MSERDSGLDVSDDEILTVFAELDESPLYPWEVAEQLPADVDVVDDQLADLEERGVLESDDEFAPGTVWRVDPDADLDAELGGERETDGATGEGASADAAAGVDPTEATDTEDQARGADAATPLRDLETNAEVSDPGEETVWREYEPPADPIASFDPPGTPEQTGQRRAALRHAYGYLREHGPADREELVEAVFPDYPGAFESPDDGWWADVIEPGFEELADVERTDGGAWAVSGRPEGPPGETV